MPAGPIAGALPPAPCSVWDPRLRAPQDVSLHARPLSHLHSFPASPGPSCRAGTLHAQAKPGQARHGPAAPTPRVLLGCPQAEAAPRPSVNPTGLRGAVAVGTGGNGCSTR